MKNIYLILILAILYFTTGKASLILLSGDIIVNIGIFIPEGIALAFALYFGEKVLFGIFLGQFLLAFSNKIELLPALEISLINTLEAFLGIYLFNKFKLSYEFKTFKDIIGLAVIIIFVLQPFSAISSNVILFMNNYISENKFIYSTFSWWFGNTMGQLLMTPFLLLLFKQYKKINFLEYFYYGLGFAFYLYILEIFLNIQNSILLLTFSVSVVILIVSKKDILYGTYFSLIAALIASYAIYIGESKVYSLGSLSDNIINYNFFILIHIIITWIIGILLEEKKEYENSLCEKISDVVQENKKQQLLMIHQNRLAQMGEMISMIAHQWRQPLNNLSLINQLLISRYNKGKLDDEQIEYFKKNSKKQINLMSRTIDDFRNFFKAEKRKEEFVVNDIIQNTLDMTRAIYTSNNIQLEFHAENSYKTFGYPNTLAQAILNIINNARDALIENRKDDERRIIISLTNDKEYIFINIKDNAGGIPEEILDKIFDPYFSTKQEKNGTGLGLYMSSMIIKEQSDDAKLSVKNETDGANFMITLKGELHVND